MGGICFKKKERRLMVQKRGQNEMSERQIAEGKQNNKVGQNKESLQRQPNVVQVIEQQTIQEKKRIKLEEMKLRVEISQKRAEEIVAQFYNLIKTNGNAEIELKHKKEKHIQLKQKIRKYQKKIAQLKQTQRKITFSAIQAPEYFLTLDQQIRLIQEQIIIEKEKKEQSGRLKQLLHFNAVKQKDHGNYKKAIGILNEEFPLCLQFSGEGSNDHGQVLYELAENHLKIKQFKTALNLYQEAFTIFNKKQAQSNSIARVLNGLGQVVFYGKRQTSEALNYFNQALNMNKKLHGDCHEDVAKNLVNIAIVFKSINKFAEAMEMYLEVLQIYKKIHEECHFITASVYFQLADCQFMLNNYDKGIDNYYQFCSIMKVLKLLLHPKNMNCIRYLKHLVNALLKEESIEAYVMQRFLKMMEEIFSKEDQDVEINRLKQKIMKKYGQ